MIPFEEHEAALLAMENDLHKERENVDRITKVLETAGIPEYMPYDEAINLTDEQKAKLARYIGMGIDMECFYRLMSESENVKKMWDQMMMIIKLERK